MLHPTSLLANIYLQDGAVHVTAVAKAFQVHQISTEGFGWGTAMADLIRKVATANDNPALIREAVYHMLEDLEGTDELPTGAFERLLN